MRKVENTVTASRKAQMKGMRSRLVLICSVLLICSCFMMFFFSLNAPGHEESGKHTQMFTTSHSSRNIKKHRQIARMIAENKTETQINEELKMLGFDEGVENFNGVPDAFNPFTNKKTGETQGGIGDKMANLRGSLSADALAALPHSGKNLQIKDSALNQGPSKESSVHVMSVHTAAPSLAPNNDNGDKGGMFNYFPHFGSNDKLPANSHSNSYDSGAHNYEYHHSGKGSGGAMSTVSVSSAVMDDRNVYPTLRRLHTAMSSQQYDYSTYNTRHGDSDLDPIKLYHTALHTGTVCEESSTGSGIGSNTMGSATLRLTSALMDSVAANKPKVFFQISTGPNAGYRAILGHETDAGLFSIAREVAQAFPAITSVWIQADTGKESIPVDPPAFYSASSSSSGSASKKRDKGGVQGLACVAPSEPSNYYSTYNVHIDASDLLTSTGMYDCILVLDDLYSLIGPNTLPFELEETLGRLLCRCGETVLPKKLPTGGVPSHPQGSEDAIGTGEGFFSYWSDISQLIEAASASMGVCSLRIVDSTSTSSSSSSSGGGGTGSTSSTSSSGSSSYWSSSYRSSSSGSGSSGSYSDTASYVSRLKYTHTVVHRSSHSSGGDGGDAVFTSSSGHMSYTHLVSLPLTDTAQHHLLTALNEYHDTAKLMTSHSGSSDKDLVLVGGSIRTARDAANGEEMYTKNRRQSLLIQAQAMDADASDHNSNKANANSMSRRLSTSKSENKERHSWRRRLYSAAYLNGPSSYYKRNTTYSGSSSSGKSSTVSDPLVEQESRRIGHRNSFRSVLASTWDTGTLLLHTDQQHVRRWQAVEAQLGGWAHMHVPFSNLSAFDETSGSTTGQDTSGFGTSPLSKWTTAPASSGGASGGLGGSVQGGGGDGEYDAGLWHEVAKFYMASTQYGSKSGTSGGSGGNMDTQSDIGPLDVDMRTQQRLLQKREEVVYRKWVVAIHSPLALAGDTSSSNGKHPFRSMYEELSSGGLVYIWGPRVSMLSIKVAQSMQSQPHGNRKPPQLVSILTDSLGLASHRALVKLLGIHNNILAQSRLSLFQLSALLMVPERADTQIVQADVFIRLLTLGALVNTGNNNGNTGSNGNSNDEVSPAECYARLSAFEEMLASFLSVSQVTYLEVPHTANWEQLFRVSMSSQCSEVAMHRYSLSSGSSGNNVLEGLLHRVGAGLRTGMSLQAQQMPWSIRSPQATGDEKGVFEGENMLMRISVSSTRISTTSRNGISVYTLLHMGADAALRRHLLQLYTDLPLWSVSQQVSAHLRPWNVYLTLTKSDEDIPEHTGTPVAGDRQQREAESRFEQRTGLAWSLQYISDDGATATAGGSSSGRQGRDVFGSTSGVGGFSLNRQRSRLLYRLISSELKHHTYETPVRSHHGDIFSFVEHNSGYGYLSTMLAIEFPNATIFSLERNKYHVQHHVRMLQSLQIDNNAVCMKRVDDSSILRNIVESPELFRYQIAALGLVDAFSVQTLEAWGENLGRLLSSALTTFMYVPPADQVSLAMHTFYGQYLNERHDTGANGVPLSVRAVTGPVRDIAAYFSASAGSGGSREDGYSITSHPSRLYTSFTSEWLLGYTHVAKGSTVNGEAYTRVRIKPIGNTLSDELGEVSLPYYRIDVVNMTRYVHHHYDYSRDGHKRTYTMQIDVNRTLTDSVHAAYGRSNGHSNGLVSTQARDHIVLSPSTDMHDNSTSLALPPGHHYNQDSVVYIRLHRDKDSWPIPYVSIYGITLITALRLGLENSQRNYFFRRFLKLNLYEDMAPWNIVFMGGHLDYIDYDTKEIVFDSDIPKAYRVMAVLMNYKRTIEDFKKCGSKAPTVYGLPYVSDCVGGAKYTNLLSLGRTNDNGDRDGKAGKMPECSELARPVPCADGTCHTDYISCLRSLSDLTESIGKGLVAASGSDSSTGNGDSSGNGNDRHNWEAELAQAMRDGGGMFDSSGFVAQE